MAYSRSALRRDFCNKTFYLSPVYPQRRRRLRSSTLLLKSARRERKLRCFFGITTERTPDRKRALAERAFRSSGSFPRVNREHLSSLAIRDLAHDRLPFILTTYRNSTSLEELLQKVVKQLRSLIGVNCT